MTSQPRRKGLLVIAANLDGQGGLQLRAEEVIRACASRRPVTVVTWRRRGVKRIERRTPNITLIRVPSMLAWDQDHAKPLAMINTVVAVLTAFFASVLTAQRWSCIYAMGINPEGVVGGLVGRLLRRPLTIDTWLPGPLGNVGRLESSPFAGITKAIVANALMLFRTDEIGEELRLAGFEKDNIARGDWGLRLDHFRPPSGDESDRVRRRLGLTGHPIGVYAGRFDFRQKGLDLLLRGWALAERREAQLVVAGAGSDRDRVEELCRSIDPPPLLLGWQEDVRDVLFAADFFVLPTHWETASGAVKEALATGLPGLVSDIESHVAAYPACVELVENTTEAWRDALSRVAATGRGELELRGREGRRWMEDHYGWDQHFERMEAFIIRAR